MFNIKTSTFEVFDSLSRISVAACCYNYLYRPLKLFLQFVSFEPYWYCRFLSLEKNTKKDQKNKHVYSFYNINSNINFFWLHMKRTGLSVCIYVINITIYYTVYSVYVYISIDMLLILSVAYKFVSKLNYFKTALVSYFFTESTLALTCKCQTKSLLQIDCQIASSITEYKEL